MGEEYNKLVELVDSYAKMTSYHVKIMPLDGQKKAPTEDEIAQDAINHNEPRYKVKITPPTGMFVKQLIYRKEKDAYLFYNDKLNPQLQAAINEDPQNLEEILKYCTNRSVRYSRVYKKLSTAIRDKNHAIIDSDYHSGALDDEQQRIEEKVNKISLELAAKSLGHEVNEDIASNKEELTKWKETVNFFKDGGLELMRGFLEEKFTRTEHYKDGREVDVSLIKFTPEKILDFLLIEGDEGGVSKVIESYQEQTSDDDKENKWQALSSGLLNVIDSHMGMADELYNKNYRLSEITLPPQEWEGFLEEVSKAKKGSQKYMSNGGSHRSLPLNSNASGKSQNGVV